MDDFQILMIVIGIMSVIISFGLLVVNFTNKKNSPPCLVFRVELKSEVGIKG